MLATRNGYGSISDWDVSRRRDEPGLVRQEALQRYGAGWCRQYTSASNYIDFTNGTGLSSMLVANGFTLAVMVKLDSIRAADNQLLGWPAGTTVGAWEYFIDTSGFVNLYNGTFSSGPLISPGIGWQLIAVTKAAVSSVPRFHVYNVELDKWTHSDGGTSLSISGTNWAGVTNWRLGQKYDNTATATQGQFAWALVKNAAWTDMQVEQMGRASVEDLLALSPNALWVLDQTTVTTVTDRTGGGSDESAVSGTAAVNAAEVPVRQTFPTLASPNLPGLGPYALEMKRLAPVRMWDLTTGVAVVGSGDLTMNIVEGNSLSVVDGLIPEDRVACKFIRHEPNLSSNGPFWDGGHISALDFLGNAPFSYVVILKPSKQRDGQATDTPQNIFAQRNQSNGEGWGIQLGYSVWDSLSPVRDAGASEDGPQFAANCGERVKRVVVTYDGSAQRVYVDGVLLGSDVGSNVSLPAAHTDPFRVGDGGSWVSSFNGVMGQHLAVYDYALSATQVKKLYDLSLGVLPLPAGYTNQITNNPGFETNTTGWSATGAASISRITTDARSGLACLQVDTSTDFLGVQWNNALGATTVDQLYEAVGWVKAKTSGDVGKTVQILLIATDGAEFNTFSTPTTLTASWQKISVQGRFTSPNTGINVGFRAASASATGFLLDDVSLALVPPGGTVPPVYLTDDFENARRLTSTAVGGWKNDVSGGAVFNQLEGEAITNSGETYFDARNLSDIEVIWTLGRGVSLDQDAIGQYFKYRWSYDNPDNGYQFVLGGGAPDLQRIVAGTPTTILTATELAQDLMAGDQFGLQVIGSTHSIYYRQQGDLKWSLRGSVVDTTFKRGLVGAALFGGNVTYADITIYARNKSSLPNSRSTPQRRALQRM